MRAAAHPDTQVHWFCGHVPPDEPAEMRLSASYVGTQAANRLILRDPVVQRHLIAQALALPPGPVFTDNEQTISRRHHQLKVAAAQTFVSADISKNGEAIRNTIAEAAIAGARLVNFCEGALSGYAKSQIVATENWPQFDWQRQENELKAIAATCAEQEVFAVVGAAHHIDDETPPHNSLYVFSDTGQLLTRYDKRLISHSELDGWYTPGTEAIVFEAEGIKFGLAICIESQFPEIFIEYENLGVDAVLFSSYRLSEHFQIVLRAHAGLNCIWISSATPAQEAHKGPAHVIGPDGCWMDQCKKTDGNSFALANLDRDDPAFHVPIKLARPWRASAREGDIYRNKYSDHLRSRQRNCL